MKKIVCILIVLITVVIIGLNPFGKSDDLPEEPASYSDEQNGAEGIRENADTADGEDEADEADEWETASLFGSSPDPASFNLGQVPGRRGIETIAEPRIEEPDEQNDEEPLQYNGERYPTVLMYHCVHEEPYTENTALFVRPSELEKQLQLLSEMDIDCLFADEFAPVDKNSVILTFDDGYEDNYTYMFPLIKKYNIKVTVYMIAYKIDTPGYLTSEQIKEMSESGLVQFGSHTLDHPSLTTLGETELRNQFEGSNWLISKITGKPVTTVAYPAGKYNDTVMEIAGEYYSFAYTTDAVAYCGQDPMMLPRYAILREHSVYGFKTFID